MVLLPRAVTPLLARRARRYRARARDAGVQTNRELCRDTKRIITRRLDRSYICLSLPLPLLFLPFRRSPHSTHVIM